MNARADTVAIRVQPRSSRNQIHVRADGMIVVRLTAPPVEGAANRALIEFLAGALDVPKSAIEIAAGARSREKRIRVASLSAEALSTRLRERAE
jgi:uncharacterized protein (TIGR00251 family)